MLKSILSACGRLEPHTFSPPIAANYSNGSTRAPPSPPRPVPPTYQVKTVFWNVSTDGPKDNIKVERTKLSKDEEKLSCSRFGRAGAVLTAMPLNVISTLLSVEIS